MHSSWYCGFLHFIIYIKCFIIDAETFINVVKSFIKSIMSFIKHRQRFIKKQYFFIKYVSRVEMARKKQAKSNLPVQNLYNVCCQKRKKLKQAPLAMLALYIIQAVSLNKILPNYQPDQQCHGTILYCSVVQVWK